MSNKFLKQYPQLLPLQIGMEVITITSGTNKFSSWKKNRVGIIKNFDDTSPRILVALHDKNHCRIRGIWVNETDIAVRPK